MKKNTLLLLILCLVSCLNAQVLLDEDFEGIDLPVGWTQETMATDGGWLLGTATTLQSQYWSIPDNGSRIIVSNDDACNCDKSADYLIFPPLDFSDLNAPILEFDLFYGQQNFQGSSESATIEVSMDGGANWTVINTLNSTNGWETQTVGLADYAGMENVLVAFHYDDNGGWLFGIALDNVSVKEQTALDIELANVDITTFGETEDVFPIKGTIINKGFQTITSFTLSYTIDGGTPITENYDGLSIESFQTFNFTHPQDWIPSQAGSYDLTVDLSMVNGEMDLNTENNSFSQTIDIFEKVVIPNRIDDFVDGGAIITEIAGVAQDLDKPTDLDFFPILGKYELWVINERIEDSGGNTVTFYNVGRENQETLMREDGNAWHFMSLPTGIAFAENGFFATSPGVLDANHSGGTFTGPTLWTSDPDIYARPSGGNGSHMDMLHGSPYSMGIAHERDNVYWVFDGYNNHPARYDFVEDHGPGADDHSDGRIQRFAEIEVNRDGDIPSHLVIDKSTGWLYMCDVGNDRVLRLNTNTGTVKQALDETNEELAEHSEMEGLEWEVLIDSGLEQPCGIEVIGNRLLVGDYATGDIAIYAIDNNFEELGRIQTGNAGLTGLKVGPEGRIWFTNRLLNQLSVAEPNDMVNTIDTELAHTIAIAPNPTEGRVQVHFETPFDGAIKLLGVDGRLLESHLVQGEQWTINLQQYTSGVYILHFVSDQGVYTERIRLK